MSKRPEHQQPEIVAAQPREAETGRYGFAGDWARLCACGHELGIHTAMAPHECLASDACNIDPERYPVALPPCDCVRFRKQAPLNTTQLAALRAIAQDHERSTDSLRRNHGVKQPTLQVLAMRNFATASAGPIVRWSVTDLGRFVIDTPAA